VFAKTIDLYGEQAREGQNTDVFFTSSVINSLLSSGFFVVVWH